MEILTDPTFLIVKNILGEAAASDFMRSLALFVAAAYVHSKTVAREIRTQLSELSTVLRDDLTAQKLRIYRLEQHLKMGPDVDPHG